MDMIERERVLRFEVEVPIYGTEAHADTVEESLVRHLSLKLPKFRIKRVRDEG